MLRLALLLSFGGVPTDATPTYTLPQWLAGCWVETREDRWTEECWTSARGGMMLGSGRSGRGDRLGHWETMQIIAADPAAAPAHLVFWGAPRGQNRTAFAWDGKAEANAITFVNAAHDYPQRISYRRDGEELVAETSLIDGTKLMRWRYRRP